MLSLISSCSVENHAPGCGLWTPCLHLSLGIRVDHSDQADKDVKHGMWAKLPPAPPLSLPYPTNAPKFSWLLLHWKTNFCANNTWKSRALLQYKGYCDGLKLHSDWRSFFTHTLYQQQGADTHFADTRSDFALLGVIYSVVDKNIKCVSSTGHWGQWLWVEKVDLSTWDCVWTFLTVR